jgi:transcriptional regulator with XRE-family HTH domain
MMRQRLAELGLEQKDLARAARVTESYISQLLARKRMPPAPDRSDIYERIEKVLKLPRGELAKLAGLQRKDELIRELGAEPAPLFGEVRALVLRKCRSEKRGDLKAMFETQPFGELERLVTQTLLDVVKRAMKDEMGSDRSIRAFLETDVFHLTPQQCASFLEPAIEWWDLDLGTFALDIMLRGEASTGRARRFEFIEREAAENGGRDPAWKEFLRTPALSGGATPEELAFLERLPLNGKRPTALYYYRELQNLRDPLHFLEG